MAENPNKEVFRPLLAASFTSLCVLMIKMAEAEPEQLSNYLMVYGFLFLVTILLIVGLKQQNRLEEKFSGNKKESRDIALEILDKHMEEGIVKTEDLQKRIPKNMK